MATKKQINANRQNGKKGGPKTVEGKFRSSQNATTHGLSARSQFLNTNWHAETLQEWEEFSGRMLISLSPQSALAEISAEVIIKAVWRLHRQHKLEEAVSSDTMSRLQYGDRLHDLILVNAQIATIRESLKTLGNDIENLQLTHIETASEYFWNKFVHLPVFLEKMVLFGEGDGGEVPEGTRIDSIESMVQYLGSERSLELKTILEKFQLYLQEQSAHWNSELLRMTQRYEYFANQAPHEVAESAYLIEVASNPLVQASLSMFYRLQRTISKMLRDYQKLNQSPIVPQHGEVSG